jgi:tRNA threonylcarbamoyladenosine biosynthesis protein TsaE
MDIIFSLDTLGEAVQQFRERHGSRKVIAIKGGMGAGKTTFIQALAQHLGVIDSVSSPTFSIINHYATTTGLDLYHMDLYRLSGLPEAMDLGLEDLFFSDAVCLIEWPEIIKEILPEDTLWIEIVPLNEHQRQLKVLKPA